VGQAGWRARSDADGAVWRHDGTTWQPDPSATRADHWRERILSSRIAMWSKQGRSYGIPFDAHPSALCWREDLYLEAGVDLMAVRTWPEFQDACLRFETYWHNQGRPARRAFELSTIRADVLVNLLVQQGVNLVDDSGVHLQHPRVVATLMEYATWVAGPRAFGRDPAGETAQFTAELMAGEICAFLAPDWRIGLIQRNDPNRQLQGRLRLRPLPVWRAGDARTTTFGGTMLGIMATCPQPEAAWRSIEDMLLSSAAFEARLERLGNILQPIPERWSDPRYHQPDPYLSASQAIMSLYIALADEVPARRVSPASALAEAALSEALADAKDHVRRHGREGLEAACLAALRRVEGDLRRRMAHGLFESTAADGATP
jgi:arabinosaccharide transport system substrate-binding protein